jgi:hypothetical protein
MAPCQRNDAEPQISDMQGQSVEATEWWDCERKGCLDPAVDIAAHVKAIFLVGIRGAISEIVMVSIGLN